MKDCRFPFYPDNWEGGCDDMTLEQEGAYLRLIILQFRHGPFSEVDAIRKIAQRTMDRIEAESIWMAISGKFKCTPDGLFYSERLEVERLKAEKYSASQAARAKKRWAENATADATADATALPADMPGECPDGIGIGTISTEEKESSQDKREEVQGESEFMRDLRVRVELERKRQNEMAVGVKDALPITAEMVFAPIRLINELAGTRYNPEIYLFRSLVTGLYAKGYTQADLEAVVRLKADEWLKDPKMFKHLAPDTLFGEKFEKYHAQLGVSGPKPAGSEKQSINDKYAARRRNPNL